MVFSLATIVAWLSAYTYIILFPAAVFEGPIVTIIAGFLASTGKINPTIAYAIIIIADLVGDTMYYAFGRWGRAGFIEKHVVRVEKHFGTHAGKTLMLGKLTHAIGVGVLFGAGVAKVPYGKFLWYNLVPTLPKTLALLIVGYYFGQAYPIISRYFDYTAIGIVVVAIIVFFGYRILKKSTP